MLDLRWRIQEERERHNSIVPHISIIWGQQGQQQKVNIVKLGSNTRKIETGGRSVLVKKRNAKTKGTKKGEKAGQRSGTWNSDGPSATRNRRIALQGRGDLNKHFDCNTMETEEGGMGKQLLCHGHKED